MQGSQQEEDNWITLLLLLSGVSGLGLFSVSALIKPVETWALEHAVLVPVDQALVPIGETAGLDIWRVAIVLGLVALLIGAMIAVVRRRAVKSRV